MNFFNKTLIIVAILFMYVSANAQHNKIGLSMYSGTVFGDLADMNNTNPNAGYAMFSYGGALEYNYFFKNNIGIGARFNYAEFETDNIQYQTYLNNELGIIDDNYVSKNNYTYYSSGFQIGVSYNFKISSLFNITPYFYSGFNIFTSPMEKTVYFKDNKTYTHYKETTAFAGFSYAPGIDFSFNFTKHFNAGVFFEYEVSSHSSNDEISTEYSYDSFNKNVNSKKYDFSALNIGLKFNYVFGKDTRN